MAGRMTPTSNAQVMADLDKPVFSLLYRQYLLLWGLMSLLGLGLVVGLVIPEVKPRPVTPPPPRS